MRQSAAFHLHRPKILGDKVTLDDDAVFLAQSVWSKVRATNSPVGIDQLRIISHYAKQTLLTRGVFIECGVFRGGTSLLLANLLNFFDSSKELYCLDSFEGLSEPCTYDNFHKKGDFSDTSYNDIKALLEKERNGIKVIKGWIPQVFNDLTIENVSFAHIDLDLYEPILETCKFLYPKLQKGAIMLFDDPMAVSCKGARRAVEEFFLDKPEHVKIFRIPTSYKTASLSSQAMVIKL